MQIALNGNPILSLPRRLYRWVLHWSDSRWATPALASISAIEAIFFPIPPDILLIALSLSLPKRSFWYASVCTLGSVGGAMIGYLIGRVAMDLIGWPIIHAYHFNDVIEVAFRWYDRWGVLALAVAGFSPIPFKVFTLSSGILGMSFVPFIVVSALSRAGRFFLVATLIYLFGERIASFMDRNFNLLTLIVTALLIAGFVVLGLV